MIPNPRSPGRGYVKDDVDGTSFAAPVVSGALALMMEHFRGTRGNTAIVRRMLDTADRSGVYAQSHIYGAGHLDLEAALSPVGTLTAGQGQKNLHRSALQTPAAFGAMASALGNVEVATFDAQGFPFWVPAARLVSRGASARSPIPEVQALGGEAPSAGLDALGLHWTSTGKEGSRDATPLAVGFGPTSVSVALPAVAQKWGYGFSASDGEYLGARSTGAFGSTLRSGLVWASRSYRHEVGRGVTFEASATLGAGAADYEGDAMFDASPSVLSAFAVRVGSEETGLTIEQPLRAESGTGTFRLENGWVEDGHRLYDEHRVSLRPDARELRMTLSHEREAASGQLAVALSGATDAGHVAGERDVSIGIAWRRVW